MFRLQELTGFTLKALPKERTEALRQAWETSSDYFYPMKPLEGTIELLRQLTRTRESIQTTIRESAQFRLLSALREIRFILPLETGKAVEPIEEAIKRLSGKQSFQDEIKKALQELESALPGEEKKEFFPLLNLSLIPDLSLEQKKMKKG